MAMLDCGFWPDLRSVLGAVIAGVGGSVLPRYLVDPALTTGTVVKLHEPRYGRLSTLWLVAPWDAPEVVADVSAHLVGQVAGGPST